ncbi:hypothetical protein BOX15_Mlig021258g2, partial [Macrostomum lignano]
AQQLRRPKKLQPAHLPRMAQSTRSGSGGSADSRFELPAINTRHNPHPHRCVHISSLHGCQVPSVVDDQMPLHLHVCYPTARPEVLRAAAAKPSEQLNGLAKPEHLEQFSRLLAKDKSESCSAWRGALSSLTRETFGVGGDGSSSDGAVPERPSRTRAGPPANPHLAKEAQRLYSPLTGRLVAGGDAAATSAIGKLELLQGSVISMLCRILQTQDRAAVQAWLMAASPRERELVTDIIQSSVANRDEYFVQESLPAACSICRTESRLPTRSSRKTVTTDSGSGGDGATKPSTAAESAGNSASSSRQPTAVQLSLEGGLTGTGKPWAARAAALTPVAAAGRRTSLPSLLAGKGGPWQKKIAPVTALAIENRRFKRKTDFY